MGCYYLLSPQWKINTFIFFKYFQISEWKGQLYQIHFVFIKKKSYFSKGFKIQINTDLRTEYNESKYSVMYVLLILAVTQ